MKYVFFLMLFLSATVSGQSINNKQLVKDLKEHIEYLSDDKLEGRRTGTPGEKLAYEYIIKQFQKIGLKRQPQAIGGYKQTFWFSDDKQLSDANSFIIFNKPLVIHTDYFPLGYSGSGKVELKGGEIYHAEMLDIGPLLTANTTNPHFDVNASIIEKSKTATKMGKRALFVHNSSSIKDNLRFDPKDKTQQKDVSNIPVVYLTNSSVRFLQTENAESNNGIQLNVSIDHQPRTGTNVIGYIDNKAATTVVLGAHYDHLGYGEDKNSLYAGKDKMIHNGADDNASGTAALIELAGLIKKAKLKNNNYVFVAFSGEELGLFGSKYFIENLPAGINNINYMINMDMLGRLNDSTRGITVGGYGTTPVWNELVSTDTYLKIKTDSSGSGPSDHTSFYRKDIPVLFFFTGTHQDYHKPSDDAEKINYTGEAEIIRYIYKIVERADTKGKLAFIKTREAATTVKSSFKVSLGIMPDYTFSGDGVLVDGVTDGRAAQKAGIKAGDVIYQLGDHAFSDVQTYMGALNKFNKGESTKVKVKRGNETLVFDITF